MIHRDATITPAADALVTLAELKEYLGVAGSTRDAELTALTKTASAAAEAYCDNLLGPATVAETIITDEPAENILLSYAPARALSALTADGAAVTLGDVLFLKSTSTVRRTDGTRWGTGTYAATYTAGPAAVREDVRRAVLEIAKYVDNAKARNLAVASEEVADVGSTTYLKAGDGMVTGASGAAVPSAVATLLAPYVVRWRP